MGSRIAGRRCGTIMLLGAILVASAPVSASTAIPCAGDCDANGVVAVGELVIAADVMLASLPLDECAAADGNDDGRVDVGELVAAVLDSLAGCGPAGGSAGVPGGSPQVEIVIGEKTIPRDGTGTLVVRLQKNGASGVVATLNDIVLPPQLSVPEVVQAAVLAEDIDAAADEIAVDDASTLPELGFVVIEGEIVSYAGIDGNVLLVTSRGSLGSQPSAHSAGTQVTVPIHVPDCAVDESLFDKAGLFRYLPDGCDPSVDCVGVRAAVVAIDNLDELPDGTPLYSCRIDAGSEIGRFGLPCPTVTESPFVAAQAAGSPFAEEPLIPTACEDGSVTVVGACVGDSNGDGLVDVAELVNCAYDFVNSVEDGESGCDRDGNGFISLGELQNAFLNDLRGCPIDTEGSAEPSIGGEPLVGSCPGDCDENGRVIVGELVLGVNVALGSVGIDECRALDIREDSQATIDELIAAVDQAMNDCPMVTPTVTPTSSPTPSELATMTSTPAVTPTPTTVRTFGTVEIELGDVIGVPGGTAALEAVLSTEEDVVAIENVIQFDPPVLRIAAGGGSEPDCWMNEKLQKRATNFAFLPLGCRPETDCNAVRAIVFDSSTFDPIPSGSLLYTCNIRIASDAQPGCCLEASCVDAKFAPPPPRAPVPAPIAECNGALVDVLGTPSPVSTPTSTTTASPVQTAAPKTAQLSSNVGGFGVAESRVKVAVELRDATDADRTQGEQGWTGRRASIVGRSRRLPRRGSGSASSITAGAAGTRGSASNPTTHSDGAAGPS